MPADGISLPAKGGLRHVLLGRLEVRLPQPLDSAKGAMTACGTKRTSGTGLTMSVLEGKADLPVAYPDFSL
jgi:hypothetical protein